MDSQARPSWYSCSRDMIEELVSPREGRLNSLAVRGMATAVIRENSRIRAGALTALINRMDSLVVQDVPQRVARRRVILAALSGVYACLMKKVNCSLTSVWTPGDWPVRCRCCGPRW